MLLPCLAAAADGGLRVTEADCARLVKHRPAPGVEYRPGVDVHGRPVAPADLDGGGDLELPEIVSIDITVDIQERFGIPASSTLFKPEAFVGIAEFRFEDERVAFNGTEIGEPEQRALTAACAEVLD